MPLVARLLGLGVIIGGAFIEWHVKRRHGRAELLLAARSPLVWWLFVLFFVAMATTQLPRGKAKKGRDKLYERLPGTL